MSRRINVRWRPDELAELDLWAREQVAETGRRMSPADAVVELLRRAAGGETGTAPEPMADRAAVDRDVIEVHRNGLDMGLMAVRAAVDLLETPTGPDVPGALHRLRNGALAELEPYLPAAADSGAQGAPERRAPDSKPVPGGHRKAPPADPPERRETSRRLTDADVGRWVREDRGSDRHAHKLTRLGKGGTGDTACGKGVDLRYAERLDGPWGGANGAGRYCRKCRG